MFYVNRRLIGYVSDRVFLEQLKERMKKKERFSRRNFRSQKRSLLWEAWEFHQALESPSAIIWIRGCILKLNSNSNRNKLIFQQNQLFGQLFENIASITSNNLTNYQPENGIEIKTHGIKALNIMVTSLYDSYSQPRTQEGKDTIT